MWLDGLKGVFFLIALLMCMEKGSLLAEGMTGKERL